jgi:hypothetical protein
MPHEAKIASTIDQVAQACNISVRRVNQLAREGVLPRDGRGSYNLGKCMAAYIRYLQQAMSSKSMMDDDGNLKSLQGQRSTLLTIQIDRESLELAKARGDVMSVADHERIVGDLIIETKARVMSVAPGVSAKIEAEDSRLMIQAKIDKALKEAMAKLAKTVPAFSAPPLDPQAQADPAPVAAKAPKGERKKGAKATKAKRKGT